jgi:nanoRNase/pAp phosphatase (c-di-AMP/oligoRNAs hydrolase)
MPTTKETVRKLQELKTALGSARRVLVVTHDNPDPDCVASAKAFKLILEHMDREVLVASGGELGRSENRTLRAMLQFEILPLHEVRADEVDFFLFLDSQPGSGNNSCRLPAEARYGIIDHHIEGEAWPHDPVFSDIRESYGATATLAYEYLLARNLRVDVPLATALYYAIRTETSDMGRGACKADRTVYLKLHPKIDWDLLHEIVHSRVPPEYFVLLKNAVERAVRHGRAMVVDLGPIHHPDFVAEIADSFMRLEGVNWVLVWGWREDRVVFSIRNRMQEPHVGRLARELVGELGSAGGHCHMAGGQLPAGELGLEEVRLQFRRTLVPAFLRSVGQPVGNGVPLELEVEGHD